MAMLSDTRRVLQGNVDAIAARAQVKPPHVKVWRRRSARYNALTHCIAVSVKLAQGLDSDQLYTLLAHEIGHAARRAKTMRRVARYMAPAVVVSGFVAAAGVVAGIYAETPAFSWPRALGASLIVAIGIVVAGIMESRNQRGLRRDVYAEELLADRFATRMAGHRADIPSVLHACARIERAGVLTPLAHRRIAFLRRRQPRVVVLDVPRDADLPAPAQEELHELRENEAAEIAWEERWLDDGWVDLCEHCREDRWKGNHSLCYSEEVEPVPTEEEKDRKWQEEHEAIEAALMAWEAVWLDDGWVDLCEHCREDSSEGDHTFCYFEEPEAEQAGGPV